MHDFAKVGVVLCKSCGNGYPMDESLPVRMIFEPFCDRSKSTRPWYVGGVYEGEPDLIGTHVRIAIGV